MPMDPGEPPERPGPPEPSGEEHPPEPSGEEQWSAARPVSEWRQATRTGLLQRYPLLGIALVVVLALGAGLAIVAALRAGRKTGAAGGVVRIGVVGLPSLDPADARDPKAVMVVDQVFDTLVRNGAELGPLPGLARSFEPNADQTAFTFHLDTAARFDDGSPVTAADVKFTLERLARKGSPSPLAAQLEPVVGFARLHVAGSATGLDGVETPDPGTVVVRLDQPFSSFPAVLGHPGFGIVPRAAVERLGDRFKATPVGSGPFRRVEPAAAGRISLRRVSGHAPQARVEGIDVVDFADAGAASAAFAAGSLDLAPVPPARAEPAARAGGRRVVSPYIGLVFYAMNLKSPELADPRFRQAITLAVDRGRIVDDVYQGTVALATGVVADGVARRDGDACGSRCRHDPGRAKALLAQAFPDGKIPALSVDYDEDSTQEAVAASIKADLDAVGIPTTLRPHPFADYGKFLVSGGQQLFRLGWIADYPSPDGFLVPLFSSTSPDNLTGLASSEVDKALAAARGEADPPKRLALYLGAEQMVLNQYVVVPVAQLQTRMVASPRLSGYAPDPLGSFDGAAVSLSSKSSRDR